MKNFNEIITKLRKRIIEISYKRKSAHLGSSLSCLEILFVCFLQNKKNNCEIILSKGHAALAYYVVLEEFSKKFNASNFILDKSNLWGHITKSSNKNNFLKFGFGSLGYGLGISAGLAYSNRKKKVLTIVSDGELNEGSFWESLFFVHHHKLKNLILLIDYNKIQSFGFCKDIIDFKEIKNLFKNYNFFVTQINGHDVNSILKKINLKTNYPKIIICNTVKGKGISRIENTIASHYKPALLSDFKK